MNTCIDCGSEYEYDSQKPMGASSDRCCSCRKKNTKLRYRDELLRIASAGELPACACCHYNRFVGALNLVETKSYLERAKNKEEEKKRAASSYILCNNCLAEKEANKIKAEVNRDFYPIRVSFYEEEVVVVKKKKILTHMQNGIEAEVVTGDREIPELRSANARLKRIGSE